jgi:hypothetical protein
MTGARRQKKARLRRLLAAGVAVLLATGLSGERWPAGAATTERIVTDKLTGLALNGFDPVAYFADRAPRLGEGTYEFSYAGAVWRFANEGNRAAFERDPEVYMPRFGGYDPIDLARGAAIPGHPLIWLISGDRLYLFSKLETRGRFAADVEGAVAVAEHHWREVERTLVP